MGGTFDPIHYGHLAVAEEAVAVFELDRVLFVPCGQPPHKKDYPVTPAEHRYAMTLLATAGNPRFFVAREEIDRPGPSYAVDTLREFRRQLGKEARFYFITGADAVREILTWRKPDSLVELGDFIAAARPGYPLADLERAIGDLAEHVHSLPVPGMAISSTELRVRVQRQQPIRYFTPACVASYIAKHKLYRTAVPVG